MAWQNRLGPATRDGPGGTGGSARMSGIQNAQAEQQGVAELAEVTEAGVGTREGSGAVAAIFGGKKGGHELEGVSALVARRAVELSISLHTGRSSLRVVLL